MIVQEVSSTNCRGWEGNTVEYVNTEHTTLKGYLTQRIIGDGVREADIPTMLDGSVSNPDCGRFHPGGNDEDGYHYEGDETCVSYYILDLNDIPTSIKVRECIVDIVDYDVLVVRYEEFKTREELWSYIEQKFGLEDVRGDNIKQEQENANSIIFERDGSFIQWNVL